MALVFITLVFTMSYECKATGEINYIISFFCIQQTVQIFTKNFQNNTNCISFNEW